VLIELMEEVVVEILSYVNNHEGSQEVSEDIEGLVENIRKKVCRAKGLSDQEYAIAMKKCIDSEDEDILNQALLIEKLIQDLQNDIMPKEMLICDPKYTKSLTTNAYRWICLSDIYIDYTQALEGIEDIKGIHFESEVNTYKKLARRALILEKKIKSRGYGGNDYFNMVKKPYCKYRLEDKDFDYGAKRFLNFCGILRELINERYIIPEFETDPLELKFEDIQSHYENLQAKYSKIDKTTLQAMPKACKRDLIVQEDENKENGSIFLHTESVIVQKLGRNKDETLKEGEEIKSPLMDSEEKINVEEAKNKVNEYKEEDIEDFKEFKDFKTSDEELTNNLESDLKNIEKGDMNGYRGDEKTRAPSQPEELIEISPQDIGEQSKGSENTKAQDLLKTIEEMSKSLDEDSDIPMEFGLLGSEAVDEKVLRKGSDEAQLIAMKARGPKRKNKKVKKTH